MKTKYLVISLILIVLIATVAVYVVNNQKIMLPLDRINKLDADIVYEVKTENWYSKIVVVYDPEELTDSPNFTKNFYYLEYIGDERIIKESKPLKYTWTLGYQKMGGVDFLADKLGISPITMGMPIDMYPDKAILEIDLDGQVEILELLKQE